MMMQRETHVKAILSEVIPPLVNEFPKRIKQVLVLLLMGGAMSTGVWSQGAKGIAFKEERAKEDYGNLKDSTQRKGLEIIKYIPILPKKNIYFSIGGSYRARMEHFSNRFWFPDDLTYYAQRLSFHTDLYLGKYVRFFGEFYHGLKTGPEEFPQSDLVDWHQGFVEVKFPVNKKNQLTFTFGRQEMKLGAGRLVDLRVGPNMRRSFDLGKASFQNQYGSLKLFYGHEVNLGFDAFDNAFSLFDAAAPNARLGGAYSQFSLPGEKGGTDLYYLYFGSDNAAFNDVLGSETRHSTGIRRWGKVGNRFSYNTEFIYQFGQLGSNQIRAFNLETDYRYAFVKIKWRPTPGLKFDWSTGDRAGGDGILNSFNPMFVNPAIYSLAGVNTPVNLLSIHPSLLLFPSRKIMLNLEFASFFRASREDGLYIPVSLLFRNADGLQERHIGNVVGLFAKYTHNRHLSFDIRSSYFTTGNFVDRSGSSLPIFHIATTGNFLF
ncbi:MAG: alginate export family protein [Bacteroidota bacterium]